MKKRRKKKRQTRRRRKYKRRRTRRNQRGGNKEMKKMYGKILLAAGAYSGSEPAMVAWIGGARIGGIPK